MMTNFSSKLRGEQRSTTPQRLASTLSLLLTLGLVITPQGCGGVTPVAAVPRGVASQLEACAVGHEHHLGAGEHAVRFDVELSSDGQVDSVALRDATFSDRDLELCMASAMQSLSEDELPARRAEVLPGEGVAPASRPLFGFANAAAACLYAPPCLLTVVFLIGGAYIAVQIYVRATTTTRPPSAQAQVRQPTKPTPTQPTPTTSTGPTPPLPPEPPDCPRNESFAPNHTDNATGCITKKGKLQCYAGKHHPCAGVHTHGRLIYQEIRNGVCKEVRPKAIRCDGPFKVAGPCGSVPTTICGDGGPEISGIFEEP